MSSSVTSWLLAGALAASLVWNIRQAREPAPEPASNACERGGCSLAASDLDLSPAQRNALERLEAQSCGRSSALERTASERAGKLFAELRKSQVDEARVRALASEVGELRGRALAECVETLFAVRKLLSAEQLDDLFERCRIDSTCR